MDDARYINWWIGKNRSRETCDVCIGGVTVLVNKEVFSPDPEMTNSSFSLMKSVPDLAGKSVLDVGCGCGILAIYSALNGAERVTAVDIDENALDNTRQNVARLRLNNVIEVVSSNLFNAIHSKYDVIVANLPIFGAVWTDLTEPVCTTYERFLAEFPEHLLPGGQAFLGFASFGDLDTIRNVILKSPRLQSHSTEAKFGVEWHVFEFG